MNDKAGKLFEGSNLVFIATIMKDGSPQLSPVWANYEDEHILVNTAEGRLKHKNVLRDPRVAVSAVDQNNPLKKTTIRFGNLGKKGLSLKYCRRRCMSFPN